MTDQRACACCATKQQVGAVRRMSYAAGCFTPHHTASIADKARTEQGANGHARQQAAVQAQRQLAAQHDVAALSPLGRQLQGLLVDTLAASAAQQEAYDCQLATHARDEPQTLCVLLLLHTHYDVCRRVL